MYCSQGQFYIDPWQPVEKAIITHAHSDHARPGSASYLCHRLSVPLLKLRLGDLSCQSMEWAETIFINGVAVSLHPAGHMIGSAQVRVSYKGEVWVVSGDYKTENDGISGQFEPIPCNVFITESTFGLPIYRWKPRQQIEYDIQNWVIKNKSLGKTSILLAYSLGKAQRVLRCLHETNSALFAHGAIANVQEVLNQAGWDFPAVQRITPDTTRESLKGAVILAPPGAEGSGWMKRFSAYEIGICSGWMQVRGNVRRANADAGFAMSDHADWAGLLSAIKATGATKVFVTHGFQATFSRYLNESGIESAEVKTSFGDEAEEGGNCNGR